MVALNINAFSVGKMLEADKKAVVYKDVVDSVAACFAAKATSTLDLEMVGSQRLEGIAEALAWD